MLAAAPQLDLPTVRPNVIRQDGQALLELRPVVLRAEQLFVKRALDVIGGAIFLTLLSPLLAIVADYALFWLQRRLTPRGLLARPS